MDSQEAASLSGVSHSAINLAFPGGALRELERPLPEFTEIPTAVRDFQQGNFLVVLDNEDRENEGDLIIAAEAVSLSARFLLPNNQPPCHQQISRRLNTPMSGLQLL